MWLGIVLSVIGVILLAALWFFFDFKRQSREAVAYLQEMRALRPKCTPDAITRIPSVAGDWALPSVAKIAGPIKQLGFTPVGVFEIAEIPGIETYPLIHESHLFYAIIHRLVHSDRAWFEFGAWGADGTVIELASTPLLVGPPPRQGKVTRYVPQYSPGMAFTAFRRMCRTREMVALTPETLLSRIEEDLLASFAAKGNG